MADKQYNDKQLLQMAEEHLHYVAQRNDSDESVIQQSIAASLLVIARNSLPIEVGQDLEFATKLYKPEADA